MNQPDVTSDGACAFFREAAGELLEHLRDLDIRPRRILNVCASSGITSRLLADEFPSAQIVTLAEPKGRESDSDSGAPLVWIRDFKQFELSSDSADLATVVFPDVRRELAILFRECRRALRPGGVLAVCVLGDRSFAAADMPRALEGLHDMRGFGDMLLEAEFARPVVDADRSRIEIHDGLDLMRQLSQQGCIELASGESGMELRAEGDAAHATDCWDLEVLHGIAFVDDGADMSVKVPFS